MNSLRATSQIQVGSLASWTFTNWEVFSFLDKSAQRYFWTKRYMSVLPYPWHANSTVSRQTTWILLQLHRSHITIRLTTVILMQKVKGKSKAFPLQAWTGPEGSRKLRFPDLVTSQNGGKVVSLTHRPPLPPGNTPGTHFCERLSRHQRHSAIGKILCQ